MDFENSLAFAKAQDKKDELGLYRSQFLFPKKNNKEFIYLCGNSLGLQPKVASEVIKSQLDSWADFAVEGWFEGDAPWMFYHKELKRLMAPIVGALPTEVCPMNTLTINLHLLLVSFYQPKGTKFKIIMEGGAFPSDQYAIESQVKFHGFDPNNAIIEVFPREGEETLRTEDIVAKIEANGDEIALVLFGGINYYTGQWYDMETITKAGHKVGAIVGWDLAHAAGNVPVQLHDWGVDFACWCSYKYQNAGPGGIGAIFVHEKHFENNNLNRFAGWWGYQEKKRFKMEKGFIPDDGADGWQVSCTQVIPMALYHASLQIFESAGFLKKLRLKSINLTGYLEFIINQINIILEVEQFKIITPRESESRGAQLSIIANKNGKQIFDDLVLNHILGDWREPNVIRLSPIPLYNSFEDIYLTGLALLDISKKALNKN
ncbi:kynureninase [Pedobacter mucosus]|uniref:kynureninase n=1 Tax=Pedobacter mucosus TaxID=2895286 RepID=UPI001EE417EF|nr:kynureninase [Pedobacter mucosus]UKT65523.1 kynureninase [Pedobacter mucosus]